MFKKFIFISCTSTLQHIYGNSEILNAIYNVHYSFTSLNLNKSDDSTENGLENGFSGIKPHELDPDIFNFLSTFNVKFPLQAYATMTNLTLSLARFYFTEFQELAFSTKTFMYFKHNYFKNRNFLKEKDLDIKALVFNPTTNSFNSIVASTIADNPEEFFPEQVVENESPPIYEQAFQNWKLKGVSILRFRSFLKTHLLSNHAAKTMDKFIALFCGIRTDVFTSHNVFYVDPVHKDWLKFGSFKRLLKDVKFHRSMWISESDYLSTRNGTIRCLIWYSINNINDFWFLQNKSYLNSLHYFIYNQNFPLKKKLDVAILKKFYASFIYTIIKFDLKNPFLQCIDNPYILFFSHLYRLVIKDYYDDYSGYHLMYYHLLLEYLYNLINPDYYTKNFIHFSELRSLTKMLKLKEGSALSTMEKKTYSYDRKFIFLDKPTLININSAQSNVFLNFLLEDFYRTLMLHDKSLTFYKEDRLYKKFNFLHEKLDWDIIEPLRLRSIDDYKSNDIT